MGWFAEKFEVFRKQSIAIILTTIFCRFFLGMGIGILLAVYVKDIAWIVPGWILVAAAILVHLVTFLWYKK